MYIIKLFDQYFVQAEKNKWSQIVNPHMATQFETVGLAKQWMKNNTTFSELATYKKAAQAITEYDIWIAKGGIRCTFDCVNNTISRKYDPNNDTSIDVLNWRYDNAIRNDNEVRYEDYRTWPRLYEIFSHIFEVVTYRSKNNALTRTFSIYTSQDGELTKFKEELKFIIPKVELKLDGYKQLNIMDHECSEVDTYAFLYKNDKDCKIVGTRYSHTVVASGDIKQVFEVMKRERWSG